MSLEEAQRSPIASSPGQAPSTWGDSDEERYNHYKSSGLEAPPSPPPKLHKSEEPSANLAPGLLQPAQNAWSHPPGDSVEPPETPGKLQSKNPFLKPRSPITRKAVSPRQDPIEGNDWSDHHSNTTASSEPLSQSDGFIPMTARLSLFDPPDEKRLGTDQHSLPPDTSRGIPTNVPLETSPWESQHESQPIKMSPPQELYLQGQPANPYAPAVVVQHSDVTDDPFDHQSAYSQGRLASENGAHSPSGFSNTTSATSHELIDLDEPTSPLGVYTGLERGPSSNHSADVAAQNPTGTATWSEQSPALHPLDDTPLPVLTHSRPKLSAAEEARQQEQRSETYSIRQINWMNKSGSMLQSPILIQNKNGPCPLLALVNALVLRADPVSQPPIVKALQTREQISLGLLIEALFEELITCLGPNDQFPDIEALSQFLTMLHTGMNVNPRLTLETENSLGTFFETADLKLYSTFGVPLLHGWLAPWSSQFHHAMSRTAQYHEDIQLLPFTRQELEDRVERGESLSSAEESKMADIHAIQQFVDFENPTQLSPFGLTQLNEQLAPGSVSIFFRNDHFSTLYKHPLSHRLLSLVTDAGYENHAEVVWESLADVTGFNAEFLSGDFRAVSHTPTDDPAPSGSNNLGGIAGPRSSSATANDNLSTTPSASPGRLSPQEQADADFAYALSLQFQEEEQREQNETQTPNHSQNRTSTRAGPIPPPTRRSSANLAPPNRTSHIMSSPPNVRSPGTTGLRQTRQPHHDPDPDDPNAPPPPYEQAARTPPYHSPERQPRYQNVHGNNYTGGSYSGNRDSRNRYSDYQQHPSSSYRNSTNPRNSKDCIVM